MSKFVEVPEFQKDLKKLKFDITSDLEVFKKALGVNPTNLNGSVIIPGFGGGFCPVFKARKFRCKAIKKGSRSGIRVIYTHNFEEDEITLIEVYFKPKKENHDLDRIKKYLIKKS